MGQTIIGMMLIGQAISMCEQIIQFGTCCKCKFLAKITTSILHEEARSCRILVAKMANLKFGFTDNHGRGGRMVEIEPFLEAGNQEAKLVAKLRGKTGWISREGDWVFNDLVARSVLTSYEGCSE